ncbi:Leucine-rich repeat typical subtype [Penicillium alfredii]|uniref:Leucine-rich repeat typical subtype n=1 Tax=Penicillium alfredii TaxID=1506179 RepID=A0A9W9F9S5_9EURO|nr:Leucine-rich repeat typical subtype [Penicillium alfredii]KAJ5096218.1 Leucine-rich repeat typical subtype [Penicillium alfredii]
MERQPKPSGIPRLASRLPLPTSTLKPIRPSPSRERLQADPGLDHNRLRRPSHESLFKKPPPRHSTPTKPRVTTAPKQDEPQAAADDVKIPEDVSVSAEEDGASAQEPRGRLREERPSLSERTMETIAQIPPSPASVRRQSSFFNGASPIRSPSRTPSNVSSYSRSPSRSSSSQQNGNDLLAQPVSKLRLPSRSRMSTASSLSTFNAADANESPSKMRQSSARNSVAMGEIAISEAASPLKKRPLNLSVSGSNKDTPGKNSTPRPSPNKTSSNTQKSEMGPPERPLHVRKTRKAKPGSPSTLRTPSAASRYASTSSHAQDELSRDQQAESENRKVSKSSSALRESIAKAKAARKAAAEGGKSAPQAAPADQLGSADIQDPFNQLPKGSNPGVLRKRVETARSTGLLNIAALSLTEIPKEVLTMYDFDPDSSSSWFENVDLVKFIAADNELAEVSDATFPDIDPENFDPDSDDRGLQFGALETLDLHGNVLQSLPMGLRWLQHLRSLNLSHNSLSMENIQVIIEIPSLTDLKLANNQLQGPLPSAICGLRDLESLDLRGNALTELPQQLAELTCLKMLDVSDNQLVTLPFEELSKLPLRTLNCPNNKLEGTLIPASVDRMETLQSLNVANNVVENFSANEMLAFPSLHTLLIGVNRIKHLPCVSSWQSLLMLSAEDNSLAELPSGLVELKKIKTVDFTGNDISRLDEKLGFMESLSTLRIANNPLRERKLLSMDTEEIKQDMRNRCEPDLQDTDDEGSVATQFTLAPETPTPDSAWRIKPGGVLDRSHSDMTDLETEKLEVTSFQDIRCFYLQHNELRCFPVPALGMLAQGLVELDLSHNPLNSSDLVSSTLELPKLQTLTLNAASLTTLEPLMTNLAAPSLAFLDVSNNRLTGSLPRIRQKYPEIKTFLASDNQISRLDFEAVQGLQVLDVGNNDIDFLPPKIGLLGAERSPRNWGNGSALRRFEVAGNRFRVPRWQVVAKGTEAVLEFLRERIPTAELPEWETENEPTAEEY